MGPDLWELFEDGKEDDEVAAIIRLGHVGVLPKGVRVVTDFGEIVTVRMPRASIPSVSGSPEVAGMSAGDTYLGPDVETDNAEPATSSMVIGPTDERRPSQVTATGRGVVVGVVDWGFDFAHPDFRHPDGRTRIAALWDQRGSRRPESPQPFGYGIVHDRGAIDRALNAPDPYGALRYHPADADTGIGCHGTHVASIAAGSGGDGRPVGIAPETDLILVHNAPWDEAEPSRLGDSVTLLEAIDFIARTAGDRPWVVNLSMGRHGEQHDGSTLIERGLDAAIRSAPGRAICLSTGNYFDKRIHAFGQLRPTQQRTLVWDIVDGKPTYNQLEVWYSWQDKFEVAVRSPDGTIAARVRIGERAKLLAGGTEVGNVYHRAQEPTTLDNQVNVFLYKEAPTGAWEVALLGVDVIDGRYHAWIERDVSCPPCQSRFRAEDADGRSTTGTICNGRRTIAVGAYDNHDTETRIARFSSVGPTRDGRLKPDLCAPGVRVLAARSTPRGQERDAPLLVRMSGTSMAAPHVTGTVALMFEVAPRRLRIEETHNLLLENAHRVTIPEDIPDRIGIGFLDVHAAVESARRIGRSSATFREFTVQTPAVTTSGSPRADAESLRGDDEGAMDTGEKTACACSGREDESKAETEGESNREAEGETEAHADTAQANHAELAEDDPTIARLSPRQREQRRHDVAARRNPRHGVRPGTSQPFLEGQAEVTELTDERQSLLLWNFDIDGSYLKPEHEAALREAVIWMVSRHVAWRRAARGSRPCRILVAGFASRTGDRSHNEALARDREEATLAALSALMPPELITECDRAGSFDAFWSDPSVGENPRRRAVRIVIQGVHVALPAPILIDNCGNLKVWINAFIPGSVPGYTFTVPAGPHARKTAIPCPDIALPANPRCLSRGYLTDQRSFDPLLSASVRMRSIAEFTLDPPAFIRHPGFEHITSGTTEIEKATGLVTCFRPADMSRCRFTGFRVTPDPSAPLSGNFLMRLSVRSAASDPCVNLAADIDYEGDITVFCSPRGGVVEVSFDGKIDSFPAFEMYAMLNATTVRLFHAPPPPGNTVVDLLLGAGTRVSGRARFPVCRFGGGRRAPEAETEAWERVGLERAEATLVEIADQIVAEARRVRPSMAVMSETLERAGRLGQGSPPSAAEVFDAFAYGTRPRLRAKLEQSFEVVALPGERLDGTLREADVLVRRGEGELAHVAVIASPALRHIEALASEGLTPETWTPGKYAHVVEGGARPHRVADAFARRVADEGGRMPVDQLVLRPLSRYTPAI